MRVELPLCTRCCFCLPLRYGLILWGYFRLVISALVMVGAEKTFSKMLALAKTETEIRYTVYAVLLALLMVFTLADIILNIVFVIGGHRKILMLLKAYYIYSFILWLMTALIGFVLTAYTVHWYNVQEINEFRTWVLLVDVATYVAQLFIQAYVVLLVRSEVIKLRKSFEFIFLNNAAACECMMHSEEDIVVEGKDGICEERTTEFKNTTEFHCDKGTTND